MARLQCDLCASTVVQTYTQPHGHRPGQRIAAPAAPTGYRCINPNCPRATGFPLGHRPDTAP